MFGFRLSWSSVVFGEGRSVNATISQECAERIQTVSLKFRVRERRYYSLLVDPQ